MRGSWLPLSTEQGGPRDPRAAAGMCDAKSKTITLCYKLVITFTDTNRFIQLLLNVGRYSERRGAYPWFFILVLTECLSLCLHVQVNTTAYSISMYLHFNLVEVTAIVNCSVMTADWSWRGFSAEC